MSIPLRQDVLSDLESALSPIDIAHCLRTESTALELAKKFRLDEQKVSIAGLLHDFARNMSGPKLLEKAADMGLPITDIDQAEPYLLHGPVGAKLLQNKYKGIDSDIVHAVRVHTYGDIEMNRLDMAIYLADTIEPGRIIEDLENIREVAKVNLEEAFRQAYEFSILRLIKERRKVHPTTVDVWNALMAKKRFSVGKLSFKKTSGT